MHALPAAPAPPPRRQVLVGTALAGVAAAMLVGGMLAVWMLQRERALDAGEHVGAGGRHDPRGPVERDADRRVGPRVFAQWAVYAARRRRPGAHRRSPSASSP